MSIAESIHALKEAKTNIADAIAAKGGTVNEGDGFSSFAAGVNTIPANPIVASSEEEANALLVEANVGRIFKYEGEGEGGGAAVGTPFAVGDTIDKLYFNTSVTPDLLQVEYTEGEPTALILCDHAGVFAYDMATLTGGAVNAYCIIAQLGDGSMPIVYSTEPFDFEGLVAAQGWNIDQLTWTDEAITAVNQQDLWISYISKEPFAAGGGAYEKDALYLIAEGGGSSDGNPTAVGDNVTEFYFDTTKSNEEILQAIQSLDWDNPDYNGDGKAINLFVEEQGGTKGMNIQTMEGDLFEDGGYHIIYMIGQSGDYVWMYSSTVPADAMGVEAWGWQGSSPKTLQTPFTVGYVAHKELWGSWLSATNAFASAGGVTAKKLQIAE